VCIVCVCVCVYLCVYAYDSKPVVGHRRNTYLPYSHTHTHTRSRPDNIYWVKGDPPSPFAFITVTIVINILMVINAIPRRWWSVKRGIQNIHIDFIIIIIIIIVTLCIAPTWWAGERKTSKINISRDACACRGVRTL